MQLSRERLRSGDLCKTRSLNSHSLEREVLTINRIFWRVLGLLGRAKGN